MNRIKTTSSYSLNAHCRLVSNRLPFHDLKTPFKEKDIANEAIFLKYFSNNAGFDPSQIDPEESISLVFLQNKNYPSFIRVYSAQTATPYNWRIVLQVN